MQIKKRPKPLFYINVSYKFTQYKLLNMTYLFPIIIANPITRLRYKVTIQGYDTRLRYKVTIQGYDTRLRYKL